MSRRWKILFLAVKRKVGALILHQQRPYFAENWEYPAELRRGTPKGSISPIRLHNAYIGLDEIENIMEHISSQPKPENMELPEFEDEKNNPSDSQFSIDGDTDEFLYDAAKLVVNHQQASVSLLQRKLRVGYSRAGRLVDELESLGVISEHNGSKPRDVLVDNQYIDNIFKK